MGEQPVLFRFENSIGRFLKLLLQCLVVGSALGGVTGLAMLVLANIILDNNPMELSMLGMILFVLSVLFIVGLIAVSSFKTWFWSLTFDKRGLTLKPLVGDQITALSHEINEIKRQGELVVFKTMGQDLIVDLAKFPPKERVLFNTYTKRWPFKKLSDDQEKAFVKLNEFWRKKDGVGEFIEVDLNTGIGDRTMPRVVVSGAVVAFIMVFAIGTGLFLVSFIVLLVAVPVLWILWNSASPQKIRIDASGIHYQRPRQPIILPWSDVEAVLFETTDNIRFLERRFYVWSKNDQAHIPVQYFSEEQFSEILKSVYFLNKYNIPYEVKLPEWLTRN